MDPQTLRFAETHEWVHIEGEIATIGISQFAVDQLSDLTMIELPEPGQAVAASTSLGEIESVKNVSDIYAPVAGEVVESNERVKEDLMVLTNDPYGEAWLVKLKVTDASALESLMNHESYQKAVADEA